MKNTENLINIYEVRTVELVRTIKGQEVTFKHKIENLSDEIWLSFHKALNPRRVVKGNDLIYAENEQSAVEQLYKNLVNEIPEGYAPFFKQELTKENFHSLIPYKDKKTVIEQLFVFEVSESDEQEFFFDAPSNVFLEISFPVGGEVYTSKHVFKEITKGSEKAFTEANEREGLKNFRRFKTPEIPLSRNFLKLAELFDSLTEGFDCYKQAPIWHKVALIDFLFSEYGEAAPKN